MTRPSLRANDLKLASARSNAMLVNERFELYLGLVRQAQNQPENEAGSDKSWVEHAMWEYQQHYRKATRGG